MFAFPWNLKLRNAYRNNNRFIVPEYLSLIGASQFEVNDFAIVIRISVVKFRFKNFSAASSKHAQGDQLDRENGNQLETFDFGVNASGKKGDRIVAGMFDYVRRQH